MRSMGWQMPYGAQQKKLSCINHAGADTEFEKKKGGPSKGTAMNMVATYISGM